MASRRWPIKGLRDRLLLSYWPPRIEDTQPTHTIGFYFGRALSHWAQFYCDTEKFMGAG